MHREFLLPESVVQTDGVGPEFVLLSRRAKQIYLTLRISRITEHQNLEVSIWGSSDRTNWGSDPLALFSTKFYRGVYSILLNLTSHPGVRFVRVQWKVGNWGGGEATPTCEFSVCAEQSDGRARAAVC